MSRFVENFSNQAAWDAFISRHSGSDGGLLQSWAWGEVQRAYGRNVWRLALEEDGNIVYAWQVIGHALPLGKKYWYAPRPVSCQLSVVSCQNFFDQVIALGEKEHAVFLRVDVGKDAQLEKFGFRKMEKVSVQPREELVVDITAPDDALLSAMKPKTRYNIRLAEKHGVTVSEIPLDDAGFSIFWSLVSATASRQKIRTHPERCYRVMFSAFAQANTGHLLVANWHGAPLSCALISVFNGVAAYLHGGSSDEHGEVMAPHLLHWEAMRSALRLGCRGYNFGGVSSTDPAWAGLTRFKQGFAPNTTFTQYGGVWERGIRGGWYHLYRTARNIKK